MSVKCLECHARLRPSVTYQGRLVRSQRQQDLSGELRCEAQVDVDPSVDQLGKLLCELPGIRFSTSNAADVVDQDLDIELLELGMRGGHLLGIASVCDGIQNENLELPGGPLRKQFLSDALQLLLIAAVQDDIEALRRELLCESQADTIRGSRRKLQM